MNIFSKASSLPTMSMLTFYKNFMQTLQLKNKIEIKRVILILAKISITMTFWDAMRQDHRPSQNWSDDEWHPVMLKRVSWTQRASL